MSVVTQKSVFYHMPKTGGTYIERAIERCGIQKARTVIGQHFAPVDDHNRWYKERYAFTVVRNPIHWMRSVYGWLSKNLEAADMLGRCAVLAQCVHNPAFDGPMTDADGGFKRFINRYLELMPGILTVLYNDYTNHCDFVGRTEDLPDCLLKALKDAGEKCDELMVISQPQTNAGERDRLQLYHWDLDQLDKIIQSEKTIFQRWYPEVLEYSACEAVMVS